MLSSPFLSVVCVPSLLSFLASLCAGMHARCFTVDCGLRACGSHLCSRRPCVITIVFGETDVAIVHFPVMSGVVASLPFVRPRSTAGMILQGVSVFHVSVVTPLVITSCRGSKCSASWT